MRPLVLNGLFDDWFNRQARPPPPSAFAEGFGATSRRAG